MWQSPVNLGDSINTSYNDWSPCISSDGQRLYFASSRPDGYGDNDIYVSEKVDGTWQGAVNLGHVINTVEGEKGPWISSDGTKLYFDSDRSGGQGNSDIWVSRSIGGEWQEPTNLGPIINTNDLDQFPCISSDGSCLYFTSFDRLGGYGNFDIWVSEYQGTFTVTGTVGLSDDPPDSSGTVVAQGENIVATDPHGEYILFEVPLGDQTFVFYHDGYDPVDSMLNVASDTTIYLTLIPATLPDSFFDDFESGPGNWIGGWHITDGEYHSEFHSLTDSPEGDYAPNTNDSVMAIPPLDLSEYLSVTLSFWTKYTIEESFDFGHIEVSTDNGASWIEVESYTGEQNEWGIETIDLSGFAGEPDARIRFRLTSDGALQMDGWYIDDVSITGSLVDTSAPLIIHIPLSDTFPKTGDVSILAEIRDVSGISEAYINYKFDVEPYTADVLPDSNVEDDYYFTIPESEAGTFVEYYISASDGVTPPNTADSPEYGYISGIPLFYDDGDAEYIVQFDPGEKIAVRFSPTVRDSVRLTTALLRFYTDPSHDLDSVYFHLWSDASGLPGSDIIDSFKIYPSNTTSEPEAWTPVDLRDYSIDLASDFHIGCEFISDIPVVLYDSPMVAARSTVNYSGYWQVFDGDIHVRATVGPSPQQGISESEDGSSKLRLYQNTPNPFTGKTIISYSLSSTEKVRLEVFDISGRRIRTLVDAQQEKGTFTVHWNGRDEEENKVASGIYFLKITAGNLEDQKKITYLR